MATATWTALDVRTEAGIVDIERTKKPQKSRTHGPPSVHGLALCALDGHGRRCTQRRCLLNVLSSVFWISLMVVERGLVFNATRNTYNSNGYGAKYFCVGLKYAATREGPIRVAVVFCGCVATFFFGAASRRPRRQPDLYEGQSCASARALTTAAVPETTTFWWPLLVPTCRTCLFLFNTALPPPRTTW